VPGKRLDYADRARRDLEAIEKHHLEVAGDVIADRIIDAIQSQAEKIAALGLMFRPGIRRGTRECVMTRYPYTLVYRIGPRRVEIAVHQRAEYFQRGR
jgi:plasmid stabilization system protein ParE